MPRVSGWRKIFGSPLESVKTPVSGLAPVNTDEPSSSKLVAQPKPAPTVKGNPLVQRARPLNPQPPSTASTIPCDPPPQRRPFPKGSSQTQLALTWCLVSKSETARHRLGLQALITWLLNAMPLLSKPLTRSALEPTSMDLE